MTENKTKVKDNNFSNLPENKYKKVENLLKNKAANKDKFGKTQNLENMLSKIKNKDNKENIDKNKNFKPPKPKRENEVIDKNIPTHIKPEIYEQFKR